MIIRIDGIVHDVVQEMWAWWNNSNMKNVNLISLCGHVIPYNCLRSGSKNRKMLFRKKIQLSIAVNVSVRILFPNPFSSKLGCVEV